MTKNDNVPFNALCFLSAFSCTIVALVICGLWFLNEMHCMVTDVSHYLNLYFETVVIQPISTQFLSRFVL